MIKVENNTSTWVNAGFSLIVLAAIVSRFYGLDRLSLWADELWVVVRSIDGTMLEMLKNVYQYDNHPPGYYVLSRLTQQVFGSSDFAIRCSSALAGIAVVWVTFSMARQWFNERAGVVASALVAGSWTMVYYSQEARPNMLMALLALLALMFFLRLFVTRQATVKNLCGFWLSAALCAYMHYSGMIFVFSLGLVYLVILLLERRKEVLVAGLKAFLPFLLLYAPWLPGMYHHLIDGPVENWQRAPDLNTLKNTVGFLFYGKNAVYFLNVFALLGVLFWIVKRVFQGKTNQQVIAALVMLAMVVLPIALFFIKSSISQSAYNHRHFIYAVPIGSILVGVLIMLLLENKSDAIKTSVSVGVAALVLLLQSYGNSILGMYRIDHFKAEFRENVMLLAQDSAFMNNDRNLVITSSEFYLHYLKRLTHRTSIDLHFQQPTQLETLQRLINERQAQAFYFLEVPRLPKKNDMLTEKLIALKNQYQIVCRTRFNRSQVVKFEVKKMRSETISLDAVPECPVG